VLMPPDAKDSPQEVLPALDQVLVAFQKTLARAAQATAQVMRDTPAARLGLRNVYVVKGLRVELKAGLRLGPSAGGDMDQVVVDFSASPDSASLLTFEVAGQALPNPLTEDSLILLRPERKTPDGATRPLTDVSPPDNLEIRAALFLTTGDPVVGVTVSFIVELFTGGQWAPFGATARARNPQGTTDASGVATTTIRVPRSVAGTMLRVNASAQPRGATTVSAAEPLVFNLRKP
jgi:hypothetical protein